MVAASDLDMPFWRGQRATTAVIRARRSVRAADRADRHRPPLDPTSSAQACMGRLAASDSAALCVAVSLAAAAIAAAVSVWVLDGAWRAGRVGTVRAGRPLKE
jgi:hypothetical protein